MKDSAMDVMVQGDTYVVVGDTLHEYLGLGAGGQADKSQVPTNLSISNWPMVQGN
jgi:hypothetical protein